MNSTVPKAGKGVIPSFQLFKSLPGKSSCKVTQELHEKLYAKLKLYHGTDCRSHTLLISHPVAKYSLAKFGHVQEAKFQDSFWV